MIFLTVGTQFPFDRLVKAVDELIGRNEIGDKIFAQIGDTTYKPKNFESVSYLEKKQFDKYISDADSIISHAGMGTITMALEKKKPLLVMPRLKKYGEVVNDHQMELAVRYEKLGYLLMANSKEGMADKIKQIKTFIPRQRENQSKEVAERIIQFLNTIPVENK